MRHQCHIWRKWLILKCKITWFPSERQRWILSTMFSPLFYVVWILMFCIDSVDQMWIHYLKLEGIVKSMLEYLTTKWRISVREICICRVSCVLPKGTRRYVTFTSVQNPLFQGIKCICMMHYYGNKCYLYDAPNVRCGDE